MRTFFWLMRRLGIRRGWRVWRMGQAAESDAALIRFEREHAHPFRTWRGKPTMPAYRRGRR